MNAGFNRPRVSVVESGRMDSSRWQIGAGERHDLVVERAAVPRSGGADVRTGGELVLLLAADRVLLGEQLGPLAE